MESKSKKKFMPVICSITTFIFMMAARTNYSMAESGIGTAEVQAATDNIKRVITSIAMPLRWNFNICKYCCSCFKNDSKCQ